MSTHQYEIALYGDFFAKDLKPILHRLTLHSSSSQPFHSREVVFEPTQPSSSSSAPNQPNYSQDPPILLRAKKELTDPSLGWILYSYLKPESVRAHPEATVRPWATVQVVGDAMAFASGLGYQRRSQIYKRGYAFKRGGLVIQMFQQEQLDPKTQMPIKAHENTLWEVEVKTASPVRNTQETPLSKSVEEVLEIQSLMKGLLDLRRRDT